MEKVKIMEKENLIKTANQIVQLERPQKNRYATKKKGKTEVEPFRNFYDIQGMINYFKGKEQWDNYLTFMLALLLGRRIGDTISMKWSDLFFENGRIKDEINTIEEQKTGKTTRIYVSDMVKKSVELYLRKTNRIPQKEIDSFIFNVYYKTDWINRKEDNIYKTNDIRDNNKLNLWLDEWCIKFNKDFTDKRKQLIIEKFNKQKEYESFGEYLYYRVEYMDIVKWQIDKFRREFDKAANAIGVNGKVSCHSLRKTFGYITRLIHAQDVDNLEILRQIFNHSDVATTSRYIGLSEDKKRQYFMDMGDTIDKISNGDIDVVADNTPVVTIKTDDFRKIILEIIKEKNMRSDIQLLNMALKMSDKLRIHNM